jgi:hypothetical protein
MDMLKYRENGKIIDRILSRTQYESIKDELVGVNAKTELSNICGNFKAIKVYVGTLNF